MVRHFLTGTRGRSRVFIIYRVPVTNNAVSRPTVNSRRSRTTRRFTQSCVLWDSKANCMANCMWNPIDSGPRGGAFTAPTAARRSTSTARERAASGRVIRVRSAADGNPHRQARSAPARGTPAALSSRIVCYKSNIRIPNSEFRTRTFKNNRFHQTAPPPLESHAPAARRWTLG